MRLGPLLTVVACATCLGATLPARAAILGYHPDANVALTPYPIDLTPGSELVFDSNYSGFESSIGVATTGTTEVFSVLGAPSYFQPFATNGFPSDQLGSFQTYAASTPIDFTYAIGTIGFEFSEADGEHFGLAKIGGSTISSYYVNTTPGEDISLAVPEPSTWLFMLAGMGGIGVALRKAKHRFRLRFKDALAA